MRRRVPGTGNPRFRRSTIEPGESGCAQLPVLLSVLAVVALVVSAELLRWVVTT